jgi:RHS repeat-associated protein
VAGDGSAGTWSYPNIHGDIITTANASGDRTGTFAYDPFGQPIDPSTGQAGTTTADQAAPNNLTTGVSDAWVGQNQKLYEHIDTLAAIEMGARLYIPALGRFSSPDPIEGGVDNAYTYPLDPVNLFDLTGNFAFALPALLLPALELGGANFWNPVGWTVAIALTVTAVAVIGYGIYEKNKKRGTTEAGNRGASTSGKVYGSEEEARSAAKEYADKNPHTCTFRGPCASGDHVHVDKKVGRGKPQVRHYYW